MVNEKAFGLSYDALQLLWPLMACFSLPFCTAMGTVLSMSISSGNSCFGAVMRSTPLGSRLDCTSCASHPNGSVYFLLNCRLTHDLLPSDSFLSSCLPLINTSLLTVLTVNSSGLNWLQSSLISNLLSSFVTSLLPNESNERTLCPKKSSKAVKSLPKFWWLRTGGQSKTSQKCCPLLCG